MKTKIFRCYSPFWERKRSKGVARKSQKRESVETGVTSVRLVVDSPAQGVSWGSRALSLPLSNYSSWKTKKYCSAVWEFTAAWSGAFSQKYTPRSGCENNQGFGFYSNEFYDDPLFLFLEAYFSRRINFLFFAKKSTYFFSSSRFTAIFIVNYNALAFH